MVCIDTRRRVGHAVLSLLRRRDVGSEQSLAAVDPPRAGVGSLPRTATRSVSSSLIVRGPISTVHTRGCASGNWIAAAASGALGACRRSPEMDSSPWRGTRDPCRQVIEMHAGNWINQDAAVEDATDHNRDAATFAQWQQVRHRGLVEQCVAASDGVHDIKIAGVRTSSASGAVRFEPAPIAVTMPSARKSRSAR